MTEPDAVCAVSGCTLQVDRRVTVEDPEFGRRREFAVCSEHAQALESGAMFVIDPRQPGTLVLG